MTDTLRSRLEIIDADCESAMRIELDKLYDNAYYDGTKFHIPSPQAVEAIWLKLIARKEQEFIQELASALKSRTAILSKNEASTVEGMIDEIFADDRYLERMQDFYREMTKKALIHESSFDMDTKRLELLDSTYRMGATNALRKARRNILAELEPYTQPGAPDDPGFLSQWRHYSNLSPLRSITTVVLLSLTSYLIAAIITSETFQGLLERFGWSAGTGL
ncbi:hypothetical protein [Nitrosospira sp. NpAV]|uniref:hypothetical protein n=1 Tax=Nitrosospira sp. NpAV TaxID=58133 RepID=UPI00059F402D|nr:hypothetical protein [Nitrosospira sp. NpAV]KIO49208.1 hypothetical protein SQ11_07990 [Nitrosospira sp. NpAV]